MTNFFQDVHSKNGDIFVEDGRVKLRSKFETTAVKSTPIDLENEVFQEVARLNFEVNIMVFRLRSPAAHAASSLCNFCFRFFVLFALFNFL